MIRATMTSGFLRSSHSHTVITVQPMDSNSLVFLRSLSTFLSNFSCQNSVFDFGRGRLQEGHLCQKHPLTKIATFRLG